MKCFSLYVAVAVFLVKFVPPTGGFVWRDANEREMLHAKPPIRYNRHTENKNQMYHLDLGGQPTEGIFLVIPEDVATGFGTIYGFAPRITKANDHRFGFGFRFGNHADLQVLYELGPQTVTKPLQPTLKVRSARVRERVVRRRPFLEFLLRAGFLRDTEHELQVNFNEDNEPR